MRKLTTLQDVYKEIKKWIHVIRRRSKRLFKTLHIRVTYVHHWDDYCYMMAHNYAVRRSCCDSHECEILINLQKFTKDFVQKWEQYQNLRDYCIACFSSFYYILLHEVRHAAQHRHIFIKLHKNKKMYDRFVIWLFNKYKDIPNSDEESPIEKDAYNYQKYKEYKDILDGLDFLDPEIEEFLN